MELTKPGLDILQPAWKDVVPASVDALLRAVTVVSRAVLMGMPMASWG